MGGWRQPVIASNSVLALWRTTIFDSNPVFALLPYRGSMKHYADKTNPPSLGLLRALKIIPQYLESQKQISLLQYPQLAALLFAPRGTKSDLLYVLFRSSH